MVASKANWSFEVFNGFTEGSLNGIKSMLLGIRAILSPVEGLDFELVQTSQWGGQRFSTWNICFRSSFIFDTNRGQTPILTRWQVLVFHT